MVSGTQNHKYIYLWISKLHTKHQKSIKYRIYIWNFCKICSVCLGVNFNAQHHHYSLWQSKNTSVFCENIMFDHIQRQRRTHLTVIRSHINQPLTAKSMLLTVTQWTVSTQHSLCVSGNNELLLQHSEPSGAPESKSLKHMQAIQMLQKSSELSLTW